MLNRLFKLVLIAGTCCIHFSQALASPSAEAKPNIKEWTFLVFLNGNNDLDSFGKMNLKQMEKVGSTDDLNIVVQWASRSRRKTQRLYIVQDQTSKQVTSPVIEDLGRSVDMGDWHSLVDFVKWGVENFPARHYMIDVWDHGSGWHAIKTSSRLSTRTQVSPTDISWDDFTGNAISTLELGQAMRESAQIIGHKVDLYASDACLMAMVEVAQEMADSVAIFGGSEEVEDGSGWPYDDLLRKWTENPKITPAELGTVLSEAVVSSYDGGQYGTSDATYSALDLSQLPEFNLALRKFGKQLIGLDQSTRDQVLKAAEEAQRFTYNDYVDLADFLNLIQDEAILDTRKGDSTQAVQDALQKLVIAHNATSRYTRAYGASIWLPTELSTFRAHRRLYETLKFHSETDWGTVLEALVHSGKSVSR